MQESWHTHDARRQPHRKRRSVFSRSSSTLDSVDGRYEHGARKWFWLAEDHDANAVLLTPDYVLAVGNAVAIHESVQKRAFLDPVLAHAILRMATDRHVAEPGHVRKIMLHRVYFIVRHEAKGQQYLADLSATITPDTYRDRPAGEEQRVNPDRAERSQVA
jgi:hypothetical protein